MVRNTTVPSRPKNVPNVIENDNNYRYYTACNQRDAEQVVATK
jgi:hypothetical protein